MYDGGGAWSAAGSIDTPLADLVVVVPLIPEEEEEHTVARSNQKKEKRRKNPSDGGGGGGGGGDPDWITKGKMSAKGMIQFRPDPFFVFVVCFAGSNLICFRL